MGDKTKRILYIYTNLISNRYVNVKNMSKVLNTNVRSIQRDLSDIQEYLNENNRILLYEPSHHNYYVSLKNNKDETEAQMNVTFEVTYQLYRRLKKQYESFIIQKTKTTITVVLFITPSEAINLCFIYRISLRIISPETLIVQFTQEFTKLQSNYMLRKL